MEWRTSDVSLKDLMIIERALMLLKYFMDLLLFLMTNLIAAAYFHTQRRSRFACYERKHDGSSWSCLLLHLWGKQELHCCLFHLNDHPINFNVHEPIHILLPISTQFSWPFPGHQFPFLPSHISRPYFSIYLKTCLLAGKRLLLLFPICLVIDQFWIPKWNLHQ